MNEETKNGATAKTVCVCALLVAAGIAGGFAAGRMTGGASNEKVQSVETAKAHPDDAKKLAKAQKRIEELERDLAAAKARASRVKALALKAENSVSNLLAKSASDVSVVTTNADIEAELKRQLPEGAYHEATNAMSRLRAKLAERAKGRYDYIAAVDTSRMSKSERDNHKKFLELLERGRRSGQRRPESFPIRPCCRKWCSWTCPCRKSRSRSAPRLYARWCGSWDIPATTLTSCTTRS